MVCNYGFHLFVRLDFINDGILTIISLYYLAKTPLILGPQHWRTNHVNALEAGKNLLGRRTNPASRKTRPRPRTRHIKTMKFSEGRVPSSFAKLVYNYNTWGFYDTQITMMGVINQQT